MKTTKSRGRMLGLLVLNALVYGTLAGTAPLQAETEDGEAINWIQECGCIRVDPKTNQCAEWEPTGCPWSKIQSCGAGCP